MSNHQLTRVFGDGSRLNCGVYPSREEAVIAMHKRIRSEIDLCFRHLPQDADEIVLTWRQQLFCCWHEVSRTYKEVLANPARLPKDYAFVTCTWRSKSSDHRGCVQFVSTNHHWEAFYQYFAASPLTRHHGLSIETYTTLFQTFVELAGVYVIEATVR